MFPFTLQQLRSLKAIETEKNFTKAAKIMHTSQPALSKQILRLEKNFNLLFIKRGSKKNDINLTKNGKVFLGYSERILGLCEESCRLITDLKNKDRGFLFIGVSQITEIDFLAQILVLFARYLPQLTVKIELNTIPKLYMKLEQNYIDLVIMGGQLSINLSEQIHKNYLLKEELNLILPKLHLFSQKKRIMKKDLYDLDFIAFHSHSKIQKFGKIDIFLNSNSIDLKNLNIILKLKSIQGVKIAVILGLGAAFIAIPTLSKEQKLNLIQIITINDFRIKQTVYILNNPRNYKSKIFEIISQKKYLKFV